MGVDGDDEHLLLGHDCVSMTQCLAISSLSLLFDEPCNPSPLEEDILKAYC